MTDDELTAIEARANAATPGPWTTHVVVHDDGYKNMGIEAVAANLTVLGYGGILPTRDELEFIAHARTDVPALVAEVRRLRTCERIVREGSERK